MLLICETARIISDQLRCGSQGQLLKIRRLNSESFSARLAVVVDLSGTPSMCCWYSCGDSKSYDNARYRHSWYFEGIDILRDDHLKKEPMDPNISAYRFVNVPTYAYNYQIMIKEHSVTIWYHVITLVLCNCSDLEPNSAPSDWNLPVGYNWYRFPAACISLQTKWQQPRRQEWRQQQSISRLGWQQQGQ